MSATQSAPSLNATPLGMTRPLAITLISRRPPRSTTAYTLPATRLPTNSVPLSPQAIWRALRIPSAHTLILNPGGSLILFTGICAAGVGVGGAATGASGELDSSGGRPCCQVGGDCGGCWAWTSGPSANTTVRATTTEVRAMRSMTGLPFEDRVENDPVGSCFAAGRYVWASGLSRLGRVCSMLAL